ncbi:M24 family metallopeptidase [Aquitalea aquatica]|uniref:Aminopeptidase P family protein n=1 Tax=Aquitalea aquatica TaxID=3044273 RepID=A0A838XYW9_9NEIS|nr:M24 family metallopeptidase [Aquitalea magnusonii]MBA4707933.1 aminopeptidase P family protein [Aquitalea magnusonii]
MSDALAQQEAVGSRFSLAKMRHARDKTFEAVRLIAAQIRPGMDEQQAKDLARATLARMGMERIWHGIIIRFGHSTLKTFKQKIDPDNVLGEHDIFFIDLGVVWDGHEGDAGATFVVGQDADMHACAAAARTLWQLVSEKWQQDGCAGSALYDYAAEQAAAMGWKLNLDIKGHRVCDFPHAIYQAGSLGDFAACPDTGVWILEIQIRHPTLPYGAFYEDLLLRDAKR